MIVIAGSGPAGAFAALSALETGAEVLMIDPGLTRKETAAAHEVTVAGLSQKRVFGSDFATRPLQEIKQYYCSIMHSNSLGGLSNVWGRGIEPPYGGIAEEHIPSFKAVLSALPFCAEEDNLAKVLPLYEAPAATHAITHASQNLLDLWNKNASVLNTSGIHFGKTRLALRMGNGGCQYTGMCFYGCTYNAMWSADQLIEELKRRYPKFTYMPGVLLTRFEETQGTVTLYLKEVAAQHERQIQAQTLILAAGAPETTRIAMRSTNTGETMFKNSDLIKIAFISLKRARVEEKFHALSQLTLTINRRDISRKLIVIHLFGQNPAIEAAAFSFVPRPLHTMVKWLLARVYIGMCFLHSEDSGEIHLREESNTAVFTGHKHPKAPLIQLRLLMFLAARVWKTGLLPIPAVGGLTPPGSSVHYGASLDVDAIGKLHNHSQVFVADAAALPDIPAGSFTLSIMAHAYRVGKAASGS